MKWQKMYYMTLLSLILRFKRELEKNLKNISMPLCFLRFVQQRRQIVNILINMNYHFDLFAFISTCHKNEKEGWEGYPA